MSETKEAYLEAFRAYSQSQDQTNALYQEALKLYEAWIADDDA